MLTIFRGREEKDFSRHSVTRVVSFQQEVFLFLPSIKSVKRGIRRGRAAPTPDCKVFLRGGFDVPLDLRDIGNPSWAYIGVLSFVTPAWTLGEVVFVRKSYRVIGQRVAASSGFRVD